MSRWCDRSIHDTEHSDRANGPLAGRPNVWNSCRGNHLGQRSCASASTGRTYGRKRSDQNAAKDLARRGPSTYGGQAAIAIGGYGSKFRPALRWSTSSMRRFDPRTATFSSEGGPGFASQNSGAAKRVVAGGGLFARL